MPSEPTTISERDALAEMVGNEPILCDDPAEVDGENKPVTKRTSPNQIAVHARKAIGVPTQELHASNKSLQAGDSGKLHIATGAVTFTLPAPAAGLVYRLAQVANSNMIIAGSGNLIAYGTIDADSASFVTTDEKAGSQALVEAVEVSAGTFKWLVQNLGGTTLTVT